MSNQIVVTEDGSHTLISSNFNVSYHSVHGAIQESNHVFIDHGLEYVNYRNTAIKVFEMGFGTGLNAWLTYKFSLDEKLSIEYHTIEQYPVLIETAKELNYVDQHEIDLFMEFHLSEWEKENTFSPSFKFTKYQVSLEKFNSDQKFDLIYFDAFAPGAQPELWTAAIFEKIFNFTNKGGILMTYCSKGQVRRNIETAGFSVEKLEGPPGKREILRAKKE